MPANNTQTKPLIFLSWSKQQSKEVATILKEFLNQVLDLRNNSDIFISTQNISGNYDGWFGDIRRNASFAPIIITCITKDSIKSPWIHYESGIGSSLKNYNSKIIPFLYNVTIGDLNDGGMGMYTYHQMVSEDKNAESKYVDMLKNLIFLVCTFLDDNEQSIREATNIYFRRSRYESCIDNRIIQHHEKAIIEASKKLEKLEDKYDTYDMYISRPMKGMSPSLSKDYALFIEKILFNQQLKKSRIYYGKYDDDTSDGFSYYRMGIISKSKYFILIYPNIKNRGFAPSSCLIELGGALALGKPIILFVEKGAKLPVFLKDMEKGGAKTYIYDNLEDLEVKWDDFLNSFKYDN